MSKLPRPIDGDRISDVVLIPFFGILQAIALGCGVFASREAITALHVGRIPDIATLSFLILTGVIAAGLQWIARIRSEALGQSYAADLRICLYTHLAGMSRDTLSARRIGALSLRFVGDLSAARNWFGLGLPRILAAMMILPGAAIVLWLLDPRIVFAGAAPILISLTLMICLAIGLEARHRSLRGRRANISITMMERIAVSPELDLMGRTERELSDLRKNSQSLRQHAIARNTRSGLLRTVPQIGAAVAGVALFWVAGRHGIAPGTIAAALAFLTILVLPIRELAGAWDQYCAWRIAREKALRLLSNPSKPRRSLRRENAVTVQVRASEMSVEISAGQITELVGRTRRHASALAAVIGGLDHTDDVTVTYNHQVAPLPAIAFIGERPTILQGSLRRAVTLGLSPRPSDRKIKRALGAFDLQDVLDAVGGLKGRLREGARELSASETLRLDLARAVLARPDLIVIDTSRLTADPESVKLVDTLHDQPNATIVIAGDQTPTFSNARAIALNCC